jgi:SAM-dependent methyltransferase
MDNLSRLRDLYRIQSKHSNYQVLPGRLSPLLGGESLGTRSRYEASRLEFITDNLDPNNRSILDIGGNTGFFSIELLDLGAKSATLYEGNPAHAEFSRLAATVLGLSGRMTVIGEYLDLPCPNLDRKYDVTLLMNVLHHLGDDFGDPAISAGKARELIRESLRSLARFSEFLVFQLGYCWKGNRALPLFEEGTKKEQVEFVSLAAYGFWETLSIGIPEVKDGLVSYREPTPENMKRQDPLGEFLNRPLFILKSLLVRSEKESDGNP